jgi:hypothetical protein
MKLEVALVLGFTSVCVISNPFPMGHPASDSIVCGSRSPGKVSS